MKNTTTQEDLQEEKQANLESFARIADKLLDGLFNYAQMSGEGFEKCKKAYYNEITDLQTVITEINNNLKS